MNGIEKLQAIRGFIAQHGAHAWIQPSHDEYLSEYPPAAFRRLGWLTGFTGSAGTVALTAEKAAFFTDGRYTLQAEAQVDGGLFEQHNISELTPEKWLAQQLREGQRAGYDARLHGRDALRRLEAAFRKKCIALVSLPNAVDAAWKDRPAAPATAVFIHELKYSGEESSSKRGRIAETLNEANVDACIVSAPDAVCWLFNIRAHDVENAPLLLSTAIVDKEGRAQLFVASSRVDAAVKKHLGDAVSLCDPATLEETLRAFGAAEKRVLCDPASLPVWFMQTLESAGATVVEGQDPCTLPRAMKNPVELQGMKSAHIRDGAAVAKLLAWLDRETAKREVDELEVCNKLLALRAQHELFQEPSFPTIAGSGPNGAIVHYRATPESNRTLKQNELFLLDSGGQYPDGTTDITRTVVIGTPNAEHKDRFTRVLKGHIAIATAQFPVDTKGSQLDALARQYLWQAGLDYDHGTGHGVGCFLNVHEGPQRISKRGGDAGLKPGMIVSNEPGYYKVGEYGIRIENLVAVTAAPRRPTSSAPAEGESRAYFIFETITCVPIDTRLVDQSMLSPEEKRWLNDYHAWVLRELSPVLDADDRAWLKASCASL